MGEAMDGAEDFTFPRVSDTYALTIDSPPLWNIPSPATHQDAMKAKESEAKVFGDDDYDRDEDTMDLLWENFNEDLYSTSASSATSSSTEMVEVGCGSGGLTMVKSNNGSVIASNSCKPGTLVLLKLLKKLLSLTNPHRKPTTSTSEVC